MRVRTKVRPPRWMLLLILLVLIALFFGSLWEPVVALTGTQATGTVQTVRATGGLCFGGGGRISNRFNDCFEVTYTYQPQGGRRMTASTVIWTTDTAANSLAREKVVSVRYLPLLPSIATLRDYMLNTNRLYFTAVLALMVGLPLIRLIVGLSMRAGRSEGTRWKTLD